MPYLLLAIGLLAGLFALYKFFINANVHQVKALFLTAGFVIFGVALLLLALTGRLPAAIALIAAAVPVAVGFLREKRKLKDKGIIEAEVIEDDNQEKD